MCLVSKKSGRTTLIKAERSYGGFRKVGQPDFVFQLVTDLDTECMIEVHQRDGNLGGRDCERERRAIVLNGCGAELVEIGHKF